MSTPCRVVNIPGVPGGPGNPGAGGADGANAFASLSAPFTMPGQLAQDVAQVDHADFLAIGEPVFVEGLGTLEVVNILGNAVTLYNLQDGAGAYSQNSAPLTVAPATARVTPAGWQGVPGTSVAGGAPAAAKYLLQTANGSLPNGQDLSALATGLMLVTTGTGVVSSVLRGIANLNVVVVDQVAGLTAGDCLFATASGVESKTAANARTALGLGTMAQQSTGAVAISGGVIAGVTVTSLTGSFTNLTITAKLVLGPSGLQTLAAANVITPAPKVRVVGNGGPVTMTSTPTVTLGTVDGELCLMMGTHDTNTVTVQDNGSLAGSMLRLGAASRALGAGDSLLLSWDATLGFWTEVAFTALV